MPVAAILLQAKAKGPFKGFAVKKPAKPADGATAAGAAADEPPKQAPRTSEI